MEVCRARIAAGLLLTGLLAACAGTPAGAPAAAGSPDRIGGPLSVFAAASLTDAFKEAGAAFRRQHPALTIQFNFAGSQALLGQLNQGAPADVFASADEPTMQRLVDSGEAAGRPRIFATNRLQIVVGPGNPKAIRSLSDLAAPDTVVVLCAPSVPCGSYAAQALSRAGVKVAARSQEQDVKAVVTKVALGEADAGIGYVTDVRAAASKVQGIDIPADQNVVAAYPITTVRGGPNRPAASAFIEFVLGPEGQGILAGHGFAKP